jgi:hypothetical protein
MFSWGQSTDATFDQDVAIFLLQRQGSEDLVSLGSANSADRSVGSNVSMIMVVVFLVLSLRCYAKSQSGCQHKTT